MKFKDEIQELLKLEDKRAEQREKVIELLKKILEEISLLRLPDYEPQIKIPCRACVYLTVYKKLERSGHYKNPEDFDDWQLHEIATGLEEAIEEIIKRTKEHVEVNTERLIKAEALLEKILKQFE